MTSNSAQLAAPRPHLSRAFRIVLVALAGLAALLAIAIGLMSTPWFRRALLRQMVLGLEDLTGGRAEIGAMHFNPLNLQITLEGLTIRGSEPPSDAPLFAATTVTARLSLVPFARRKLRLRTLDWDNASLHLITHPDGSTNFAGPRAGGATGELVGFSVGRLALARTEVSWNDQRLPLELTAESAAVLLRATGTHRYAGSFSSTAMRVAGHGWSLPPATLTSQFELGSAALDVKSITWQAAGFTGQATLKLRDPSSLQGSFSFRAKAEVLALARLLGLVSLRGGTANLEGQGDYRQGEVTVQGKVTALRIALQSAGFNPAPIDLSANYVAHQRRLEFSNLAVSVFGGEVLGDAEVGFRGPSPAFVWRGRINGFELPAVLRSFSSPPAVLSRVPHSSKVSGPAEIIWSGRFQNFRSRFDLDFHPLAGRASSSVPVSGRARGQVTLAPAVGLDLEDVRLETPGSLLSAQGSLDRRHGDLSFELVTSNCEEWRPLLAHFAGLSWAVPLTFDAPVTLAGTVAGTWTRPKLEARLEAGAFRYGGTRWDSLAADIAATPDAIQISSGRLRAGKSELALAASAALDDWALVPASLLRLSAAARKMPLEPFSAALGAADLLAGLATGRIDLQGTAENLAGGGPWRVEPGKLERESFDSLSTNLRVTGSVWNFADVELRKGRGRLSGRLSFEPGRHFSSVELHGDDFALADFERLSLHRSGGPWLEGRAAIDLRGEGTPDDFRLHSSYSVSALHLEGEAIGDLHGQINGQGRELQLEAHSEGPGGAIRMSGTLRHEGDWPLQLQGTYEDLRVEPGIHLLLNRAVSGVVMARGSFGVSGPLRQPDRLEAHAQARSLEVQFPALTWKNDRPVDVRWARYVLSVDRFHLRGPATDFEVEGMVHFGNPGRLDLRAEGQSEAALLSLLAPALQATGRSEIKLQLSSSLTSDRPAQPLINGTIDVRDVSLRYADLPFRISGLNGQIRLEGERAATEALRGTSGGGAVTLSGFVTLSEAPRFDLKADLDQVRLPYPSDATSVLKGNLHLVGTSERGQLGGELTVGQVLVSENFDLMARLVEGGASLSRRLPGVTSPLASRILLDVQLHSGAPLRLAARQWNLLTDLELSLQGTLASPAILGTVHSRSGEAFFRGNRYRLNRGEVHMTNPARTQPVLDLEATTRVQRYDLTIDISGAFDRLKFAYRSDPPLPTEDVISLLALGFSQQENELSTHAGRPLPAVQAGALLSRALSNQMSSRAQRLFGTSHIKVDPNVLGAGGASGARITFEQQVTRDLTLTYVSNTAESQYRVIQFEWAVSDNASLVGVRDQNGIFGLEIKFRRRFR